MVILLTVVAITASLPMLVLGFECLLALFPLRRDRRAVRGECPDIAVVVPAHNEQDGIARTIRAIQPQLRASDRLIVVADNCDDHTAEVATDCGAKVLERFDAEKRGKGFAIRFALKHLIADPPEVVVSIDADCVPLADCIELIARAANSSGHPTQAAYVMQPPANASPGTLISAFAVLIKNYVRPRGLQCLRMPCLITGSGVAYPWEVLQSVPHPESHIVEDMHYSIDLALSGTPPLPCMEACVESELPESRDAAHTQRTRWEHGHLSVMLSQGPRLISGALKNRSISLATLFAELMVPPLSLLIFGSVVVASMLLVAGFFASFWTPLVILTTSCSIAAFGLTMTWWRYGRLMLPASELIQIPRYILSKLTIYTKFVSAREKSWVRTARDTPSPTVHTPPNAPHFDMPRTPAEKTASARTQNR